MKIRLLVAVLVSVCLLVPLAPQAQTENKRLLVVTSPANCQAKVSQKVRNSVEEIRVAVKCDSAETASIRHSEFELEPLEAVNGSVVMAPYLPSGYAYSINSSGEGENKRTHITVRRLAESEQLPEVKDDHFGWYLLWQLVKCKFGKCDIHFNIRPG